MDNLAQLLREFMGNDAIAHYDSKLCWGCGRVKGVERCLPDCLLERTRKALRSQHWVYDAAEAHRDMINRRYVPLETGYTDPNTSKEHLLYMIDEIVKCEMSPTKACRWLGWIQGCLYVSGIVELNDLKEINLNASRNHNG